MKKIFILMVLVLGLIGCNQINGMDLNDDGTYTGKLDMEERLYDLKDFKDIQLFNDFQGTLVKGEDYVVKVTTNKDVFDLIDVKLNQNQLVAKVKDDVVLKDTVLKIEITTPSVEGVTLNNDSTLTSEDSFETEKMSIRTYNDTQFKGNFDVQSLYLEMTSDSIVTLNGQADFIEVHAKSDAFCDLSGMKGTDAATFLSSDARCIINVENNVELTSESSPTLRIIEGTLIKVNVSEDTIIEK